MGSFPLLLILLLTLQFIGSSNSQLLSYQCPSESTAALVSKPPGFTANDLSVYLAGTHDSATHHRDVGGTLSTGDLNNDGLTDIITLDRSGAGTVLVTYGAAGSALSSPTGILDLYRTAVTTSPRSGFSVTGHPTSCQITFAAFVGDINGDRIGDLGIGCSMQSKVYVVYGALGLTRADINLYTSISLPASSAFFLDLSGDPFYQSRFGWTIAGADLNGDSVSDLIVGSPTAASASGEVQAGRIHVIYGLNSTGLGPRAMLQGLPAINSAPGFQISPEPRAMDSLGKTFSPVGDVNGDGIQDLAASVYNSGKGKVFVIYGKAALSPAQRGNISLASLLPADGFVIDGSSLDVPQMWPILVGRSVSSAGDFDGDGTGDILLGYTSGVLNLGMGGAFVIYGSAGTSRLGVDLSDLTHSEGFMLSHNEVYGDGAGESVFGGRAVDFNRDGFNDILIGAPTLGMRAEGAIYILYGFSDRSVSYISGLTLRNVSSSMSIPGSPGAGMILYGKNAFDSVGTSLSVADINGDGIVEIISGAPGYGQMQPGAVLLHTPCSTQWTCRAGYLVDPVNPRSKCLACPAGSFSPGGSILQARCTKCPAGTFSMVSGASSILNCSQCPPGTYSSMEGGSSFLSCTRCPAGTYNNMPGRTACADCPMSTYLLTTGGSSSSQCVKCPAGYEGRVAPALSGQRASLYGGCSQCPAGKFSEAVGSLSCTPCPIGTYSLIPGSTNSSLCTPCPLGQTTMVAGVSTASSCYICAIGTYAFAPGVCKPCSAGTYQPRTGASACEPCPRGYYSPASGLASCTICPKGTYKDVVGGSSLGSCTPCPVGTYGTLEGASDFSSCYQCPPGTKSSSTSGSTSATDCQSCPPGTYSLSGVCTGCNPGTYSPDQRASKCLDCPMGTYVSTSGALVCTGCPEGTYSNRTGSTGLANCTSCAAGSFSYEQGSTKCILAPYGAVVAGSGMVSYTACSAGTFSDVEGGSACKPCPAGTYLPFAGGAECFSCDAGTYASSTGSEACTACPVGKTSAAVGSSSVGDCVWF